MSDTSYPSSSEEFVSEGDQNVVPGARDVLCGPPLPRDRFEQACLRVYSNSPLSLRVVLNVNTSERVVHEVVPVPRDGLHWFWDVLQIFQAQEAQEFLALQEQRRLQRILRFGGGYRLPVAALPFFFDNGREFLYGYPHSPGREGGICWNLPI